MFKAFCFLPLILAAGRLHGADAFRSVAEVPISEDYVLHTWETEDGLPNNNVAGIAESADGYLWLNTWSGVARFDGLRFTTFFKDLIPGLEKSGLQTILGESGGDLWLGLEEGALGRMRNGRVEIFRGVLGHEDSWGNYGFFAKALGTRAHPDLAQPLDHRRCRQREHRRSGWRQQWTFHCGRLRS